jgi:uncharacterized membrane protein YeaQ/YmgE (transglycosylase-associated protein family)
MFKKLNNKLKTTVIFGAIIAILLFVLAYMVGPEPNVYPKTFLISIAGCIFGWVIGVLTSPINTEEENKLNKFPKLIGTFLSGYILSKFDRVAESLVNPTFILIPLVGLRVLLFICFFCLTWILVFEFRQSTI